MFAVLSASPLGETESEVRLNQIADQSVAAMRTSLEQNRSLEDLVDQGELHTRHGDLNVQGLVDSLFKEVERLSPHSSHGQRVQHLANNARHVFTALGRYRRPSHE
jgi:hypothetical protein